LIKQSVGVEPMDTYGLVEVNEIAWECKEHDGYHINADTHFVEILDKEGNEVDEGKIGEIVVTCLFNTSFPIIRYKTGDYAIKGKEGKCKCGRRLPKIQKILGRNNLLINNKTYFETNIMKLMYEINGLDWFQINKKNKTFSIITKEDEAFFLKTNKEKLSFIKKPYSILFVKKFPRTKHSGKFNSIKTD